MNPLADGGGIPLATILVIGLGLGVVVGIGGYLWYAIALSKLFPRLDEKGWKGWVPILNEATILSLGGKPAWNVIFLLVPIVQIYGLYVKAVALHRINQRFGRGAGMTVLGLLVPPAWATVLAVGPLPYPEGDRLAGIRPGPVRRQSDAGSGAAQGYLAPPILPPSSTAPSFAPSFAPSSVPAPDAQVQPPSPVGPATAPAPPAAPAGLIESVPWASGQSASASSPDATQPVGPTASVSPAGYAPAPPPPAAAPAAPAAAPAPPTPAPPAVAPPAAAPAPPAVAPAAAANEPAAPAQAPAAPAHPAVVQADFAAADTVAAPPASLRRPAPESSFAAPVQPSRQTSDETGSVPQVRPMPMPMPMPAEPMPAEPTSQAASLTAASADDEFDATIVVSRRRGARRVLVLDDGRRFALSATSIVIGRNPDGQPGEQRLAIPDKTRTLSKTHARLVVQGDEWRLTDLHSTNGVVVVADDGAETLLDAGESVIGAGRFILGEVGMHVAEESGS